MYLALQEKRGNACRVNMMCSMYVSHTVTFVTLVAFCDFFFLIPPYWSSQLLNNFKIIFNKHLVLIAHLLDIYLTDAQEAQLHFFYLFIYLFIHIHCFMSYLLMLKLSGPSKCKKDSFFFLPASLKFFWRRGIWNNPPSQSGNGKETGLKATL